MKHFKGECIDHFDLTERRLKKKKKKTLSLEIHVNTSLITFKCTHSTGFNLE